MQRGDAHTGKRWAGEAGQLVGERRRSGLGLARTAWHRDPQKRAKCTCVLLHPQLPCPRAHLMRIARRVPSPSCRQRAAGRGRVRRPGRREENMRSERHQNTGVAATHSGAALPTT